MPLYSFSSLILLPVAAMLFLCSCSNDMEDINAAVLTAKQAQQDRALDVTIIYSKGGRVEARLQAKEFIRNETQHPTYVDMKKGLRVEFFDDSLRLRNTLTARTARWYDQQNNILIRDSVHVVSEKGDQLLTEELVWNEQLKKFYTDKPVRIITPTRIIFGNGMEANQDFSWYRINNITGSVKVDKSAVPQ